MGSTTRDTKSAASPDLVRTAQRSASGSGGSGGGGSGPPEPPNAFKGKPERVPEVAFIRERTGDGFLTSAKTYYELFGIDVALLDSIEQVVVQIANSPTVFQRLLIVSHAHPRGMIIPFFINGVKGTNLEIFREFAKSDLDGLKSILPFELSVGHLFRWGEKMPSLMTLLRGQNAAALQPFGLQQHGEPNGGLIEFVKFGFDIVYMRDPKRVRRNSSQVEGLTAAQRTILENFIAEILVQMTPALVSEFQVTALQVDAFRTAITSFSFADLPVHNPMEDAHPDLGLTDDSMNDFPTLKAVVTAIHNEFRKKLTTARQKINAQTQIDVRGCRAGREADYVEAIREFFGTGAIKPFVTAACFFQSYPEVAYHLPVTRAHITSWIGGNNWLQTSAEMKQALTAWAELIRVKPLQVDFWLQLLRGPAVRFGALDWRSEIPPLFIPTPGLAQLSGLSFAQLVGKLKDYFNVPNASVPSNAVLSQLTSVTANLPAWASSLLQPAAASLSTNDRAALFASLQGINGVLAQALVPAASPNAPDPPSVAQLHSYQSALNGHLETRLAGLKTFLVAAADSLETGDGLHYYLLFAGLPVFVHGARQLGKNGIVVLHAHRATALQSWYKCLWRDALPAAGPYKTAKIETQKHRQVIAMVGNPLDDEDRATYVGNCPMPVFSTAIRKRPPPPDDDESLC